MIEQVTENRSQARTHLFVAATLVWPNGSFAARVRNVSPQGAMVEMQAGPRVGERVDLIRGSLRAAGLVVWRMGNRLGLRFDAPVVVADWLPTKNSGQQKVDEAVHQVRNSAATPPVTSAGSNPASASNLSAIADRLDDLANALSNDAEVVCRYAGHLPILDVASQKLRNLSR